MFSQKVRNTRLCRHQRGYSLVELAVSVLLIAAIAVLSFPTYQDFSPHGEAIPGQVGESMETLSTSATEAMDARPNPDQPVTDPARNSGMGSLQAVDDTPDSAGA